MKNSFWGFLWQSFLEIYAVPATFLGIIVSVLAWIISSKTQVSLALVITIAVFTLIILITLFHAVYKAFRYNQKLKAELEQLKRTNETIVNEVNRWRIPKILRVQKEQETGLISFLFDDSDLFSEQLTISIFYRDQYEYEALIGIGYIKTIQTNKKIQAVIDQPISSYQDILDRLVSNEKIILDQIIVRPGIIKDFHQS